MGLTADRNTSMQSLEIVVIGAGAGVQIFAGSQVVLNATGFAIPGKTATGLTYIGRAEEYVDNRGGADGAKSVVIRREKAFKWANDGTINQTKLFKPAYVVDDETVSGTDGGGTRSPSGLIVGIDADGVWVK